VNSLVALVLVASAATTSLAQPSEPPALADATRAELARIRDQALAHDDAGRHALAAQSYQELYDGMTRAQHPRACVALWNRGLVLMQIPGREAEARETIERFLDESTHLGADPEVAGFRAEAPARIAEIDARISASPREAARPHHEEVRTDNPGVSPIGPIVLGIGGALVVAGLVLGGVALSVDGDFEDMCPTRLNCAESTRSTYDNATTLAGVADAMWIGGSVVGVVGLVLTLVLDGDAPVPESAARVAPHMAWNRH
jgi:hypothetical protein